MSLIYLPDGVPDTHSVDVNRFDACQRIEKYFEEYDRANFGPCKSLVSGLNLETKHLIGWVLPCIDAALDHLLPIVPVLEAAQKKYPDSKKPTPSTDLSEDEFKKIAKRLNDYIEDVPSGDFGFWLCDAARGRFFIVNEMLEQDIKPVIEELKAGRKLVYYLLTLNEEGRCRG